jgi:hypothetical protein
VYRPTRPPFAIRSALVLVVCLGFGAAARAQSSTGSLVGTVRDQANAALPGVTVRARSLETSVTREVVSSDEGTYEILELPAGKYELTAEARGFKRYVQPEVSVNVIQASLANITLQPGGPSETVVVEADASQVQLTNATVGKTMPGKSIVDLPLNGRNFYDLGLLQTGVLPLQPGRTLTQNSYNVNGARDTSNNFLLDGVANQELEYNGLQIKPSIDALQEFRIQTSMYSAEYGRGAGAIISAVTKSGSERFRGSLFEFLRNDAFDARNFFSPEVPPLRRHQFGGTLGGPMLLAKLLTDRKPKTFFFFSYEGLRQHRGITTSTVVPTEQERRGDLSGVRTPIIDPLTGQPFPGNVIPPERISNAARALLALYPLPNLAGPPRALNFTASPTQTVKRNQAILRVDHTIERANVTTDQFFGRYIYDNAAQDDPFQSGNVPTFFPGFTTSLTNKNQNLALGHTHIFSPDTLNVFHFGFSRTHNPTTHSPLTKPRAVGIDFEVPDNVGLPDVRLSGFSGVGNSIFGPFRYAFNTFQYQDALTFVRGRSTVKAGAELRRHQENVRFQFAENGQFLFLGVFTGDPLADFLLGRAFYFTYGSFARDVLHERWTAANVFAQDDFKLTPRLTLNLGVRYEYVTPINDQDGRTATILIRKEPTPGVPQSGVAESVLAGTNGLCDKCTYFPDRNNWAPRVGFALDVLGKGKLVLRGGYGVFFNQMESNLTLQNILQPPFASFPLVLDSGGAGYAKLDSPTCGGLCVPPGAGLVLVSDPHIRTPYMQQFNLNAQYEFRPDFVLEVGYVGTLGRKLLQFRELNQPIYIPGADQSGNPLSTLANKESRRPFANFSTIAQATTYGSSNYNSLQVSVQKRFSRGYTFLAGYTFSKSIDQLSQFHSGSGSPIDPAIAQNADRLDAERALSAFDMRHRFTLSGVFELPLGRGGRFLNRGGVLNQIAGGWSINPILVLASGIPLTVRDFTDPCLVAGPFITSCRPNLVGNPILPAGRRSPEQWINRSAFARQLPGTFGSAGRNIVFADGTQNLDVAVIKRAYFGRGEAARIVELRAEFFNLPNHPQFGVPDLDFSSPTFGRIFSTAQGTTERQIQFGLKFTF